MRAAIPLHHSTQLFSATAATLLLLLLLVPLLLLPTTTAEKIILHENQEAQQTFRAMETSKQTSPFLSATLKTNISPVYSEINQVQLNALSGALVNFFQKVFDDQAVYDVEIVGVAIFEEQLVAMDDEDASEESGRDVVRRRKLLMNKLQHDQFHFQPEGGGGGGGETANNNDDERNAYQENNAADEEESEALVFNKEIDEQIWDSEEQTWDKDQDTNEEEDEENTYTLTFATVISAEHKQHQSLSHGDFQTMLIHICHKFESHLIDFVTRLDDDDELEDGVENGLGVGVDDYFAWVDNVAVSGYELEDGEHLGGYGSPNKSSSEGDGSEEDGDEKSSLSATSTVVMAVVGILFAGLIVLAAVRYYKRDQQLKQNKHRTQELNNSASNHVKSLSILYNKPKDDDYSFNPLSTDNGYNGKTEFGYDDNSIVNKHSFYRDEPISIPSHSPGAGMLHGTITFDGRRQEESTAQHNTSDLLSMENGDDEIPNPIKESAIPQLSSFKQQYKDSEIQVAYAPPGKVGVAIDTIDGHPVVHKVKKGSPLDGLLQPMDAILAIDDVDTTCMSSADVTQLMVKRMNYRRKIVFVRDTKFV